MEYHANKIMKTIGKVQQFSYILSYRRGMRMVTFRLALDGTVLVNAPYGTSRGYVEKLIMDFSPRLQAKREMRQHRSWQEGEHVCLAGKELAITFSETSRKVLSLENYLLVPKGDREETRNRLKAYYRSETRRRVVPLVKEWEGRLSLSTGRLTVRDSHRVWASCTRDGNLSFSLRCAGLDDGDLSYLVLHELAHRVYFNHGEGFHAYLNAHMDDWKEHERHLRQMQQKCDIFES